MNTINADTRLRPVLEALPHLLTKALIICAVVGSAVGLWLNFQVRRQTLAAERESEISTELFRLSETYGRLQEIGQGRIEDARWNLKVRLANQIESLEAAIAAASPRNQPFYQQALAQVTHNQKTHPEYFSIPDRPVAPPANLRTHGPH